MKEERVIQIGRATPPTPSTPDRRAEERRRRRRRRKILRLSILFSVMLLLAILIALLVVFISGNIAKRNGTATPFMAVKSIVVEGETRYSDEEIISASGIYIGESLLSINKVGAHNAILEKFPYLAYVDVGNSSFSEVCIRVRETDIMAVAATTQGWMIVGENNHALELVAGDAYPEGTVRLIGATCIGTKPGDDLLDERCLRIVHTILDAAKANGLEDITAIDMTEKTSLHLLWRDQIDVRLGNESHLDDQIYALTALMPTLLKNNGNNLVGVLDMSSYSDDNGANDRAVFSAGGDSIFTTAPPQTEPTEPAKPGTTGMTASSSTTHRSVRTTKKPTKTAAPTQSTTAVPTTEVPTTAVVILPTEP